MSDHILEVVVYLEEAFKQKGVKLEDGTIQVYKKMLSDIPPGLLQAAAHHHVATNEWFPTIAELRRHAVMLDPNREILPLAGEAWEEVLEQMGPRYCADFAVIYDMPVEEEWQRAAEAAAHVKECDNCETDWVDNPPDFSHELVEKAVAAIGWRDLCNSDNISIERAHFFKVYASLLERYQRESVVSPAIRAALDSAERKMIGGK